MEFFITENGTGDGNNHDYEQNKKDATVIQLRTPRTEWNDKKRNKNGTIQLKALVLEWNRTISKKSERAQPQIRLNLYSQVSVLQDTTKSGTQGSHKYHSQYQSGYGSVCILRYLCYKMQLNQELKVQKNTIAYINPSRYNSVCNLNVIPNLVLYLRRVIQDASCWLTMKNYSLNKIKVNLFQLTCIQIIILQVKIMYVFTRFVQIYISIFKLITIQV